MAELTWVDLPHDRLTPRVLYDVLALRNQVFIVEQQCLYLDIDGLDLVGDNRHLLGTTASTVSSSSGDRLVAYARILAPADLSSPARIGRVIVHPDARAHRLGRELMERALTSCAQHWPSAPVQVSAQAHLREFYASLGFVARGEVYDDDGIPHLDMTRA